MQTVGEQPLIQDVRRYLAILHKRKAMVATCLGISLLAAVLNNYTTRPLYQATVQILIDKTPRVLPAQEVVDRTEDFDTEYELIRGRAVAEKVVERLGLQKSTELQTGPSMTLVERFQRSVLGRPPAAALDSNGIPLSPAVAAVRSRIAVEPMAGGRLVNIRFRAYDPSFASRVANAIAEAYIEQSLELRFTTSSEATGWLSDRLREQKHKVETAERALLDYQARQGLADFEQKEGVANDKVATLASAALAARMDKIAKESLLAQMKSMPTSQLVSAPQVLANPAVQALRAKMSDLQSEQSRLSETLGERHPDMVRLRAEMASLDDKLQNEIRNVVRALESEVIAVRAKEATLEASLSQAKTEALEITRKGIEYSALKREAESNRQLFQSLMNRTKETGLETELKASNIRIVERAEVPAGPISPNKRRNYQLALIIGLALGIGLTILFEHFDNTIRTPDDIKDLLRLPFLGMVPRVEGSTGPQAGRLLLRTLETPNSPVSEAYRVLRTNLLFSSAEGSGRVLVVTSASPGEGKTTTAAGLAGALALTGARVLAIDADLRRPSLHLHLSVSKTPGLSDLLVGKTKTAESIHSTRVEGLAVLPCGYVAPNPAELLGSKGMADLLAGLRKHYDWILIDTPPVLAMADTPVLCPIVDGVVLVIAAEASTRPAVERAIDQIVVVGGKVVGAVLNKVDLRRNSYYYSHYYGEYYRNYYADNAAAPSSGLRAVRKR